MAIIQSGGTADANPRPRFRDTDLQPADTWPNRTGRQPWPVDFAPRDGAHAATDIGHELPEEMGAGLVVTTLVVIAAIGCVSLIVGLWP